MEPDRSAADRLCTLIDASPTPYHAVDTAAAVLIDAGFSEGTAASIDAASPGFVRRGGSLVAWGVGRQPSVRLIGAHTDSPNLRVNPAPDHVSARLAQLNVEVYGGALLNSWLDRDLGVAGRLVVRDGSGTSTVVFRIDDAMWRIPQLAIHLDREVNTKGLLLDPQDHLRPVGSGADDATGFVERAAAAAGVAAGDVLAWDAMLFDVQPSRRIGEHGEFVSAPRLDNLCSSFSAVHALVAATTTVLMPTARPVVCLYDHEEVGSTSATGADGAMLAHVLGALGADTIAGGSLCLSADMAHATHPNYPERHEPDHHVAMNAGPVVKINANQRYASDAETIAQFRLACDAAGVGVQNFVSRNDMPCGSTIGPLTAARLGIPTVDVGIAQLAMHSAREMCGAADVADYEAVMTAFLHG